MTPRHRRHLCALVGLVLLFPALVQSQAFAAPIDDKRAEAAHLQDEIDEQSQRVSVLAEQYNQARIELSGVRESIAQVEADVARSDAQVTEVRSRLASAAVLAYMGGGSVSLLSAMARSAVPGEAIVRQQYLHFTAADQRSILGELRAAKEDLALREEELAAVRSEAEVAADQTGAASRAAEDAEAAQQAALARVQGEISELVTAEQARREEEQRRLATVVPPATPRPSGDLPATRVLPSSGRGAIAVAEAMKHLGKPYEWGGSGPDTFDCSGLTAYAWRAAGVSLPHSAQMQYNTTARVPIDQIVPGDLLFFGSSTSNIHHNAMYVGNREMIEASRTGVPIRIRAWRSGDLVGAGRPG